MILEEDEDATVSDDNVPNPLKRSDSREKQKRISFKGKINQNAITIIFIVTNGNFAGVYLCL